MTLLLLGGLLQTGVAMVAPRGLNSPCRVEVPGSFFVAIMTIVLLRV